MLTLVDVGGAEGLHHRWTPYLDRVQPVIFECDPTEAQKVRELYADRPSAMVVEKALWGANEVKTLNIARHFGCTSIRKPDMQILDGYNLGQFFEIVDEKYLPCERYDSLFKRGEVPAPDALKIDVQGCEYEVLHGFGALLSQCVSIELEAHFYPIYRGQKLIGDLVQFLEGFDFVLRTISPTPHFQKDVIEIDVLFLPTHKRAAGFPAEKQEKLALVKQVYGID